MANVETKNKWVSQLDGLVQLKPMPAVAMQIMKACRDEQFNVRELVSLVECDPAIAARVLSVVNSSAFGLSREVSTINQAVVVLGFKSLSQLAISAATAKVFSDGKSSEEDRMRLFDHSLGCAAVARVIVGGGQTSADAGEAFLAGMLHDIGKLVFFDLAPEEYRSLEQNRGTDSLLDLERDAFGLDHTAVGMKFGEFWGLPGGIKQAIANHHLEQHDSEQQLGTSVTTVTNIANDLAKIWGVGREIDTPLSPLAEDWLSSHDLDSTEEIRARAISHFDELKSLMGRQ